MSDTLVAMTRDTPQFPNGPVTADVHPSEVAAYAAAGWSTGQSVESAPVVDVPLDEQTIQQLRATASALGIEFTPRTKADPLRQMIREAQTDAPAQA